jgi:hypothetical protein
MTDALETLERELEDDAMLADQGKIPIVSAAEMRAAAAACRELAWRRHRNREAPPEPIDYRPVYDAQAATDAALAAFMEGRT